MAADEAFAFIPSTDGGHVSVAVRHGQAGQRALLGTLRMRPDEWEAFNRLVNWTTTPRAPRERSEYPHLSKWAERDSAIGTEISDVLDDLDALHEANTAHQDDLGAITVLAIELAEALAAWAGDDDLPHYRRNEARDYARRVEAWLNRDGDQEV